MNIFLLKTINIIIECLIYFRWTTISCEHPYQLFLGFCTLSTLDKLLLLILVSSFSKFVVIAMTEKKKNRFKCSKNGNAIENKEGVTAQTVIFCVCN